MKVAIVQPYFLPYIGYFQLINEVDVFVLYDDVNYMKKGWINRNQILLNEKPHLFTLPLNKASQNKLINEIKLSADKKRISELLSLFKHAYSKAPYYNSIMPVLEEIILFPSLNLTHFIKNSLEILFSIIDLKPKFILSSDIRKDNTLKGSEKIIDICTTLGAKKYINPIGGVNLYDKEIFKQENIKLAFIQTQSYYYTQFKNEFICNLSFIDVLMFNSPHKVRELLTKFDLK